MLKWNLRYSSINKLLYILGILRELEIGNLFSEL